jgi:hypothetical protein
MWPMLILAAGQAVSDMGKESRQRQLAASTQRYSPWTGLKANEIEEANPIGTLAQGYGAYLGQTQNNDSNALKKQLMQAQIRAMDRGQSNPYAQAQSAPQAYAQPGNYQWGDWNANYSAG